MKKKRRKVVTPRLNAISVKQGYCTGSFKSSKRKCTGGEKSVLGGSFDDVRQERKEHKKKGTVLA